MRWGTEHIIKEQLIEVSVASQDQGREIQDLISETYRKRVVPQLEALFNDIMEVTGSVQLDQIELDLGMIPEDQLEEVFTSKVLHQLSEKLQFEADKVDQKKGSHNRLVGTQEEDREGQRNQLLDAFEHITKTGTFPWNFSEKEILKLNEQSKKENRSVLSVLFESLFTFEQEGLSHTLRRLTEDRWTTRRLVYQLTPQQLNDMILMINPKLGSTYQMLLSDLLKVDSLKAERNLNTTAFEHLLWETILHECRNISFAATPREATVNVLESLVLGNKTRDAGSPNTSALQLNLSLEAAKKWKSWLKDGTNASKPRYQFISNDLSEVIEQIFESSSQAHFGNNSKTQSSDQIGNETGIQKESEQGLSDVEIDTSLRRDKELSLAQEEKESIPKMKAELGATDSIAKEAEVGEFGDSDAILDKEKKTLELEHENKEKSTGSSSEEISRQDGQFIESELSEGASNTIDRTQAEEGKDDYTSDLNDVKKVGGQDNRDTLPQRDEQEGEQGTLTNGSNLQSDNPSIHDLTAAGNTIDSNENVGDKESHASNWSGSGGTNDSSNTDESITYEKESSEAEERMKSEHTDWIDHQNPKDSSNEAFVSGENRKAKGDNRSGSRQDPEEKDINQDSKSDSYHEKRRKEEDASKANVKGGDAERRPEGITHQDKNEINQAGAGQTIKSGKESSGKHKTGASDFRSTQNQENMQRRNDAWNFQKKEWLEEAYIKNAGLILIHPFLSPLFKGMHWMEDNVFASEELSHKAVYFLQYLVSGEDKADESELVLNKLLCGLPIDEPIPPSEGLSEEEKEEGEHLLEMLIEQWSILKNTSPDGLRNTFLMREGYLKKDFNGWKLQIERTTIDILLDRLPWGYSVIKLPWLEKMIYVEW